MTAGEYGYDLDLLRPCSRRTSTASRSTSPAAAATPSGAASPHDPRLADIELSGHCAPYISLPVAAATPRLRHLEYFHDHVRIESMFFEGTAPPVAGRVALPDGPGHGLAFRATDAEEYRVA